MGIGKVSKGAEKTREIMTRNYYKEHLKILRMTQKQREAQENKELRSQRVEGTAGVKNKQQHRGLNLSTSNTS